MSEHHAVGDVAPGPAVVVNWDAIDGERWLPSVAEVMAKIAAGIVCLGAV